MLIKVGAKGLIPIGSRLTYDGFNKLYQVGTEVAPWCKCNEEEKENLMNHLFHNVHPMTMSVSDEALEMIRENPEQVYILSNFYIAVSDDAEYRTSFEDGLYVKVNEHKYVADIYPEE